MRGTWIAILVIVACTGLAHGVATRGGGHPESEPSFRIDFDAPYKDLHWDGQFYVSSTEMTGTPIAWFTMTCTVLSIPETWTINGFTWDAIELDLAQWKRDHPGEPPPNPSAEFLLVSAPGTGQEISGRAYMTGAYRTRCNVSYYNSATQQTGSYPVDSIGYVYVLGGPLVFSVVPTQQQDHPTPPLRDSQFAGPRYLQYFGYDPALLFQPGFPWEVQRAQTGHVALKYGQPGEVSHVDWTLTGPLKFVGGHASSPGDYTDVDVGATSSSAPGAATVGAKIWVTLDIGGLLTVVSSVIDPFEWPQNELEIPSMRVEDDDLYRFTAHEPDTMAAVTNPPATSPDPYVWQWLTNGPYGLYSRQYFEVYDTNGSPMPSLWVEERFTFSSPPYHWGNPNQVQFEWPGRIYSDSFPTTQLLDTGFKTNWYANLPNQGDFVWTTTPPPLDQGPRSSWHGIFGPDNLNIQLPSGWTWQQGQNPPVYDFMHHYFAATRNADPSAPSGILVGTYRLRMWTDKVLHEKQ